nr:hypothetical protein [uncultured Desulfobulbus sp.]
MSAQHKYKIARHGDRKWIEVFCSAVKKGFFEQVSFRGISGIEAMTVTDSDELPELLEFILNQNAGVLHSASANNSGFAISVVRDCSPLYDNLNFTWNPPSNKTALLSDEKKAEIISWFTNEFLHLDPDRGLFSSTDIVEAAQVELSIRSAIIDRLEQVQAKLAEDTAAFNKTIQDNYLSEKSNLDAQLVEYRKKLSDEFEKKSDILDKRATKLDEREARIDASDNTSARRQIRKDLLAELQRRSEKFALTPGTKSLRWPVHLVSLAIIAGGIAGAYYFSTKVPVPENSASFGYAITLIKPFGLTFVAVGTAFFYLRWLNRWFERIRIDCVSEARTNHNLIRGWTSPASQRK